MIRLEVILASTAVALGLGLAARGMPTVDDRLEAQASLLEETLDSRKVHLDPAEVNTLLHDVQSKVQIIDVRPEADFNLFHLLDARRLARADLKTPEVLASLDPKALKIFVANGEAEAEEGWRIVTAAGIRDAYVLEGGLALWLRVFRDHQLHATPNDAAPSRTLAAFDAALGARYPFARPSMHAIEGREFESKAKRLTKVAKPAGGCGG